MPSSRPIAQSWSADCCFDNALQLSLSGLLPAQTRVGACPQSVQYLGVHCLPPNVSNSLCHPIAFTGIVLRRGPACPLQAGTQIASTLLRTILRCGV